MSLIREPGTRQSVFADAMLAVLSIGRDHSVMQVDAEAKRLLGEHPDCPISLDEVKDYIMRFAVREGVAIEFG